MENKDKDSMKHPKRPYRLQDNDKMPWGKYQGMKMVDVPADYMFWYWTKGGGENKVKTCLVAEYINRNITAFETDYPDGIWR